MDNKMIIRKKEEVTMEHGILAVVDCVREIKPGDTVVFNRDGKFIEGTVQHIGDMGTAAIVLPIEVGTNYRLMEPQLIRKLPTWVGLYEIIEVSSKKLEDFCTDEQKPA